MNLLSFKAPSSHQFDFVQWSGPCSGLGGGSRGIAGYVIFGTKAKQSRRMEASVVIQAVHVREWWLGCGNVASKYEGAGKAWCDGLVPGLLLRIVVQKRKILYTQKCNG